MQKILVKNLYKVFGNDPKRALGMLAQGRDKDTIFRETGMVTGVIDANFHVDEGEIFVLMGLSGSGKSTLVRLLNRLVSPSQGQVFVGGQDVAALSEAALIDLRRKDMAMVFQSFALLPHLTVLENAAFGLKIAGVGTKARHIRAMEVLEQVGLGTFAHKIPAELSGGMQQRVGLARALAVNPSLMLMDEAFSALDPLKRTEMQDLLLDLQEKQRRTIVFVSHDLDEAFRIGSRIAIMHGGRIAQIGTPDEILRNPSDDYVRAFFKGIDVKKYWMAQDIATHQGVLPVSMSEAGDLNFASVAEQMRISGFNHAAIVGSNGVFLGMVSHTSLQQCLQKSQPIEQAFINELAPVAANSVMSATVARLVQASGPLPVVDTQGRYLGVVSQSAALEKLVESEVGHE